jgi:hypothetical protein
MIEPASELGAAQRSDTGCSYALLIEPAEGAAVARVFGLNARERLERSLASLGLRRIEVDEVRNLCDERVVALSTNHFYDGRLIAALADSTGESLLLLDPSHSAAPTVGIAASASEIECWIPALRTGDGSRAHASGAAARSVLPTELVPAYDAKLRKHAPPFVLPAEVERTSEAEARLFDAAYKGTTDFVTKWIWPLPARVVTGWCAHWGIQPNTVTMLSYLLTLLTLLAFWRGDFGWGLASAWLMTFLDTVDGKLARVTLTSSRLGDVLDHGLDLIHPPLWWIAWAAGLAGAGVLFGPYTVWALVVFCGYIVGRLLEGLFILAFGQEMFTWRTFDSAFRLVIARRNPNLVMLTLATLGGRPDLGLIAVASWTLCCIFIQCVRIAQAALLKWRGQAIRPHVNEATEESSV